MICYGGMTGIAPSPSAKLTILNLEWGRWIAGSADGFVSGHDFSRADNAGAIGGSCPVPQVRPSFGLPWVSGVKSTKGFPMTGIQFITDAKGRKTAAIIDLKKHKALWEDIQDVLVSRSRQHEKRIPLEKVKADLIASGKLRA